MTEKLKKLKKYINKNHENIYIYALITYILAYMLGDNSVLATKLTFVFSLIKYSALLVIILKIICHDLLKYTSKTFGTLLIIALFLLFLTFHIHSRYLLQLFIIIVGSKNVSFEKIINKVLKAEFALVLLIIFLSLTGIISNYKEFRPNNIVRYALGFKYAPSSSGYIWYFTTLYLFLKKGQAKGSDYLLLFLLNLVFYLLTDARNGFYFSLIVIGLNIFYNHLKISKEIVNEIIYRLTVLIPIILIIGSLALSIFYKPQNSFMKNINSFLSNRLSLQQKALKMYPISLFGNSIDWVTNDDIKQDITLRKSDMNYVDNSYINLLLNYGLIFIILLFILFYKLATLNYKEKKYYQNALLIIIFIHAAIDPHLLKISMNIFLLQFVEFFVFYIKKEKEEKITDALTLKEIQNMQLTMFKAITQFLDKNKITYYICGGTLLGAIRHKGFIPWDDDIDILLPRPDYEKLQEIAKTKKINKDLEIHSYELGNLNDPFCKVYNLNTTMAKYNSNDEYDNHMWIDIFPLDGLPNSDKKIKIIFQKSIFWRKLLMIRKLKEERIVDTSKTKLKAVLKPFIKFFVDLLPKDFYVAKIRKLCLTYSYENAQYVGGIAWGYGPQEKMPKKAVEKVVKVEFEKMKVKTFSCWDLYLKNLYGDYQKLPPKKDQIAHTMVVQKIK